MQVNTHNYKLTESLIPLVTPYSSNQFTISNSYNFKDWLLNVNNAHKLFMASFDITSLYTNIPSIDAIDILIDRIFSQQEVFYNFNRNEFKQLLIAATGDTFFIFNGNLYTQQRFLAMGSPLSAILENTYLSYHEENWLRNCQIAYKPAHYKRYMDDTFLLFQNQSQVPQFLEYLNKQLPNIKFTEELESNNMLPFLDLLITKDNNKINTSIFRKKTNTTLSLNFFSHIPDIYKLNTIKIFLYRAYHLSSNFIKMNTEFEYLKKFFSNNAFNIETFHQIQNKFLNTIFHPKPEISTANKQILYLDIPYYEQLYHNLKKDLMYTLNRCFPQLDIRLVFYNNSTIKRFCNHKEHIPEYLVSGIVYKFTCGDCNITYVGSTSRHLRARVSEHREVSYRTNLPLSNPPYSIIYNHCHKYNHDLDHNHFKIINRNNQPNNLNILESLAIKQHKPVLNADTGPYQLQTVL